MRQFLRDVWESINRWQSDDGLTLAAATAYYVGLSFFPLLIVLTAGVGLFLQNTQLGQDANRAVLEAIGKNMSPQLAQYVADALAGLQDRSSFSGPIGLITMLVTSLAAFAQLDVAFDRIWKTPTPEGGSWFSFVLRFLIDRGRAFLLLLGLGAIVVLVFVADVSLAAVETHTSALVRLQSGVWQAARLAATLAINTLVFLLLFKWLPKRPVRWQSALCGAILTAVAWEIGRQLLTWFIARSNYSTAYGVIGAFLGVLLWCYYGVATLLLGAEHVKVVEERSQSGQRSATSSEPGALATGVGNGTGQNGCHTR